MFWRTIQQMKSADPTVRCSAARKLGQSKNIRALEALAAALKDGNLDVQVEARWALDSFTIPEFQALMPSVVRWLLSALGHEDRQVRILAIKALGNIREKQALEPLIVALSDSGLCLVAAEAIGNIGDKRAIEPLVLMLAQCDYSQRAGVMKALERIGDWRNSQSAKQALPTLIASVHACGNSARLAARTLGDMRDSRAIEPLVMALREGDASLKEAAGRALSEMRDQRAIAPLVPLLNHPNYHVSKNVIPILDRIDPNWIRSKSASEAVPDLVATLTDKHREANERRRSAYKALDRIDPQWPKSKVAQGAVPALVMALTVPRHDILVWKEQDEDRYAGWVIETEGSTVAEDARAALLRIDPDWPRSEATRELVPNLIAALRGADEMERSAAARVLGEIGDPRALDALVAAQNDADGEVRRCAAAALARFGVVVGGAPAAVPKGAIGRAEGVGRTSVEASRPLDLAQAIESMVAAFRDPDNAVRVAAARSLKKIGEKAVEPLIAALADRDAAVRWIAVEVLGKIKDPRTAGAVAELIEDEDENVREAAAMALKSIRGC